MAKRFLGSVGKAEAFKIVDGKLQLAFVSKTLTDSGLNIQTTKEDIRGGQGAPIQFSFYHDPSVEITLTDILWKPEYLEAQLGANFKDPDYTSNHEAYITKTYLFDDGVYDLKEADPTPKALKDLQCADDGVLVWGAKQGTDEWRMIKYVKNGDTRTLKVLQEDGVTEDTTAEGNYCVRYLASDSRALVAEISTQIIPQELFLIITAPIFAGDACGGASKGKAAGSITFEVPRFQLNGAQEFQMNMSSNQTMSLSGIALASESIECDAVGGKLLRIIEVIEDRDWKNDVANIMSDEEYEEVGKTPHIYAVMNDGTVAPVDFADLTFDPVLVENKFSSATQYTITLTGTTKATNVTVAAASQTEGD